VVETEKKPLTQAEIDNHNDAIRGARRRWNATWHGMSNVSKAMKMNAVNPPRRFK
jgi:hypothetical protein